MRLLCRASVSLRSCLFLVFVLGASTHWEIAMAQDIVVSSATPADAPQGTVNLDVTIGGKGFKAGAKSDFFLSGTTNPAGITVHSTRFVSPTQLVANIDVADTALTGKFDIQVRTSSRTGIGIEKFSVLQKVQGQAACTDLLPLPSRFTPVGKLNSLVVNNPRFSNMFGQQVRGQLGVLGISRDVPVIIAAVGNYGGKLEVFFLDSNSGNVLDGTTFSSGSGSFIQSHLTFNVGFEVYNLYVGDVNNDGLPDFLAAESFVGSHASILVSMLKSDGSLTYQGPVTAPFGGGMALGNLDGDPEDELAVAITGEVDIYNFIGGSNPFSLSKQIPLNFVGNSKAVAIGDVTGDMGGMPDLIVGDSAAPVGALSSAGKVYVLKGEESFNPSSEVVLNGSLDNQRFGYRVDVGHFIYPAGPLDILVTASFTGSAPGGFVFSGVGSINQSSTTLDPLQPYTGGWSTVIASGSIHGGSTSDILIGAVNASPNNSCSSPGVAYVYMTDTYPPTRYPMQSPEFESDFAAFGWGVGAIDGTRIFLIGEKGRNFGKVKNAGQVYVYRVNDP